MEEKFATELLHEVRLQSKRWFIAFCIMVGVELATIAGFMWYISLPVEETSITQDADDASENTIVGGNQYGGETDIQEDQESSSDKEQ